MMMTIMVRAITSLPCLATCANIGMHKWDGCEMVTKGKGQHVENARHIAHYVVAEQVTKYVPSHQALSQPI